jgi:pseudaminic acid synthase
MAAKGKPMIISTGVATREDILAAIKACRRKGNDQIELLKCVSSYPADPADMNLLMIPDMIKKFKSVVGLSDHSMSDEAAIASVALGGKIIEKHFILDRKIGGPDCSFSLEPDEFKKMVNAVRLTEAVLGQVTYELTDKSKKSREFSRSLFVVEDIKTGEHFSSKNIRSIRPGFGLHPKYLRKVLGKKATKNLRKGTPLELSFIEGLN